jgi:hypothetical protein
VRGSGCEGPAAGEAASGDVRRKRRCARPRPRKVRATPTRQAEGGEFSQTLLRPGASAGLEGIFGSWLVPKIPETPNANETVAYGALPVPPRFAFRPLFSTARCTPRSSPGAGVASAAARDRPAPPGSARGRDLAARRAPAPAQKGRPVPLLPAVSHRESSVTPVVG